MTSKPDRTSDGGRSGAESMERFRDLLGRIVRVPKEELPIHKPIRPRKKKRKSRRRARFHVSRGRNR